MQLAIDTADPRPIHAQIVDEVRRAVVLGTLGAGDTLPPVRHLAAELRVNPASVAEHALRDARRNGVTAAELADAVRALADPQNPNGEPSR